MAEESRHHGIFDDGLLWLDSEQLQAWAADSPLSLSVTEFRVLDRLVRHAGTVQHFATLLKAGWDVSDPGARGRVKFTVSRLRGKLDATPVGGGSIVSVRGIGYLYRSPTAPPLPAARPPSAPEGYTSRPRPAGSVTRRRRPADTRDPLHGAPLGGWQVPNVRESPQRLAGAASRFAITRGLIVRIALAPFSQARVLSATTLMPMSTKVPLGAGPKNLHGRAFEGLPEVQNRADPSPLGFLSPRTHHVLSILSCRSMSAARSANSATRGRERRSPDRAEDSYESVDNSYCGLVIQAQPMHG
ncbi:helix-turn-helix domain-containing protein [Streptomyces sp. NBC_01571]|uniref:helix-turn-helix domain-containing protein n=1 Tax=Streptomyces sp. NBC_01571 TaxID=2975883 RepID=UPI00225B2205|nr:helix-turn-helix domain-containing protein [Streptomyces sp. NBC_01571]MCX4580659.1 helix-turn-helix domain-containing protein [Streptomyces sp. NBC_01571]